MRVHATATRPVDGSAARIIKMREGQCKITHVDDGALQWQAVLDDKALEQQDAQR